MMKKLIILLCLLMVCGCGNPSDKYEALLEVYLVEHEKLDKEYIGNYYMPRYSFGCPVVYDGTGEQVWVWIKFQEEDVSDEIDGFIKIHDKWTEKDKVFYYDEIYQPLRDKIEAKYSKN